MLTIREEGSFDRTEQSLKRMSRINFSRILNKYGAEGVKMLSAATPARTGLSSRSWDYTVSKDRSGWSITWTNSNKTSNGIPVVLLIQYGHATRNGGYVVGIDFINPTLAPIADRLKSELFREVT